MRKREYHYRGRRPRRSLYDRPELWALLVAFVAMAFVIATVILNA